jgi:hypothetical protein
MSVQAAIDLVQRAASAARGPLRALSSTVSAVAGGFRVARAMIGGATGGVGLFRASIERVASAGASFGGRIFGGLNRITQGAIGAAGALAKLPLATLAIETAASLGAAGARYVSDTLAFRENTQFAFNILARSSTKARELMTFSDELARSLGKDTVEVGGSVRELLSKGFDTQMIRGIVSGMADLSVINPEANVKLLTMAIGQVKSKGFLMMEELRGQIAEQGLDLQGVYKHIAKNLGIQTKDVEKAISGKKVTSDVGIRSILEAIQDMGGGGALGMVSLRKSTETVSGAFDRARGMARRMLLAIETGPLGSKLLALAGQLSTLFDPSLPSGKRLLAVLNDAAGAVSKMFDGVSADDVVSAFQEATVSARDFVISTKTFSGGFLEGYREATTTIRQLKEELGLTPGPADAAGSSLRSVGKALGYIVVGTGLVISGIVSLASLIVQAVLTLPDNLRAIGRDAMAGLAAGLDSAKGWVVEKIEGIASLIPASVRKILETRSPSRVMAGIGMDVTAGLTLGLDRGPQPADRMAALVQPPALPQLPAPRAPVGLLPQVAGAARSGQPIQINLTTHVDASGRDDADEVARKSVDANEAMLLRVFERLVLAQGAGVLAR